MKAGFTMSIVGVTLIATLASPAAGQDWFDNFEDGSVADGTPVAWDLILPLPASECVESGDLMLGIEITEGPFALGIATVPINFVEGVSVRARLHAPADATGIGLTYQDVEAATGYVAELLPPSTLVLLRIDGPGTATTLDLLVSEAGTTDEVIMQLDVFDGAVAATVWVAGSPKPEPQIVVHDGTYSTGVAGVFVQDMGGDRLDDAIAFARYAQAASAPLTRSEIGDLDASGIIDGADLGMLLANWTGDESCALLEGGSCVGDLDNSNSVDGADLGILLANWG